MYVIIVEKESTEALEVAANEILAEEGVALSFHYQVMQGDEGWYYSVMMVFA